MKTTEITVQYDRKFSDGNYGSEGVSLSATIVGTDGELTDETAIDCISRLRGVVLTMLADSAAFGVAHAAKRELHPPQPAAPDLPPAPMSDEAYFDAMADARSY